MMIDFLMARAKEASTWRGMILLVTAMAIAAIPEKLDAILAAGLALAGAVGAASPDAPHDRNS